MTAILFYTNPMSRGQIARWMLEEVGVPYEQRILDYDTGMKSPEYLAINPMGKVPAIIHDGTVVTECAAICAYLAETFPAAALTPTPRERADYYRWMFFAAGPVEAAISDRAIKAQTPGGMERMLGYGSYDLMVDVLEGAVSRHAHICGDRFTAADVYVGSQVIWGVTFGTLPDRPGLLAYRDRLVKREAYVRAKAIDDALIAEMKAAESA